MEEQEKKLTSRVSIHGLKMSLRSKGSLEEEFLSQKSRNQSERKISYKNEGLSKSKKNYVVCQYMWIKYESEKQRKSRGGVFISKVM